MVADWLDPNCRTCLSGLTIEINHGNGLRSFYGHLSRIDVAKGQYVRRGPGIGISGSTGTATGPHPHFGSYYVNRTGTPVHPYCWARSDPDPRTLGPAELWVSDSPRDAGRPPAS